MLRRPRISPLFPTRRSSDLGSSDASTASCTPKHSGIQTVAPGKLTVWIRSEEHTSELQSHSDLVCRLLLEKKKNKTPSFKVARADCIWIMGGMAPWVSRAGT